MPLFRCIGGKALVLCCAWLGGAMSFALAADERSERSDGQRVEQFDETAADAEWEALRASIRPAARGVAGAATREARAQRRQTLASEQLVRADRLKQFQDRYPTHSQAREAKRLEAVELLNAAYLGDDARASRRAQLVSDLRKDPELSLHERGSLAARFENLAVARRRDLAGDARVAAFEQVVRRLIAEFPDLPDGYESLLALARSSPDDRAALIAEELSSPDSLAPQHVRFGALELLQRTSWVGRPIAELVDGLADADAFLNRCHGKAVVFYSWSPNQPAAASLIEELSASASAGTVFVGVKIELGSAQARTVGTTPSQPYGEQWSRAEDSGRQLAARLALTAAPLIVIAGPDGIVRTTTAHRSRSAAFTAVGAPMEERRSR